ncbi:TAXI family TRAP transporter solute-binding subunit [Streptomyces sp. NPDC004082]
MFQALARTGRRPALLGGTAAFVVVALLLWWLLPLGDKSPSGEIKFSTGTPTGVYQTYGDLLRQAAAEDMPDLKVRLLNSDGSQDNVRRVATGEADFSIAAADAVETYKHHGGRGADRLRGCARLYDDYVHLVVPEHSKVRSVAGLRGKRVAVGPDGSGVRLIADRVLKAAGLDPRTDIVPLPDGIKTMPEKLEKDRIDAFFWSGGLPTSAVTTLSDRFPVRLVPIDGEVVKNLQAPGGAARYYRAAVIPANAYPKAQQGSPVPTVAVANLLITREDTDEDLTEALTRTVIDSRDSIGEKVHAAQRVDLRTALYTDPLDLHEGAKRYYRSVKP